MLVDRWGDLAPRHTAFSAIAEHIPQEALIVANNSRVISARLKGERAGGGIAEFLLLSPPPLLQPHQENGWTVAAVEGLGRPARRLKPGSSISFTPDLRLEVQTRGNYGHLRGLLRWRGDLQKQIASCGTVPLPPYIHRLAVAEDLTRYQTCYSRPEFGGSVAAPTAGLHFTPAIRQQLLSRGFQWAEVTLYVGYGTFSPVRSPDIREHAMHSEYIRVPEETASAVARAVREGRPVLAVGTTSARALEGAARVVGPGVPYSGQTDIFLYPGQPFRLVSALLTNFHLPGSSLLMLAAAFAGRKNILAAYRAAVEQRYRFFSYGDAMLIA